MLTYTRFQRKINICILNKHNLIKMVCNLIKISPGREGGDELGEKYIKVGGLRPPPNGDAELSFYPFTKYPKCTFGFKVEEIKL